MSPDGSRKEPWTNVAFSDQVRSSDRRSSTGNYSENAIAGWKKAISLPSSIEPILDALCGSSDKNKATREQLRKLYEAARFPNAGAQLLKSIDPAGQTWAIENDRFVIDNTPSGYDIANAHDQSSRATHRSVVNFAEELANASTKLSNSPVWERLAKASQQYYVLLNCDTTEVPNRLGPLYNLLLRLARFIETDLRLKDELVNANDTDNQNHPLDADIHGLLTDVVRASVPWLRDYPTVVKWDDGANNSLQKSLGTTYILTPAREIAQIAKENEIISNDEAGYIEEQLPSYMSDALMSQKAKIRIVGTAKNLVIAGASLITQADKTTNTNNNDETTRLIIKTQKTLGEAKSQIEAISATFSESTRALIIEAAHADIKYMSLTEIEISVLSILAADLTLTQTSEVFSVSRSTILSIVRSIKSKLELSTTSEAIICAFQNGLITYVPRANSSKRETIGHFLLFHLKRGTVPTGSPFIKPKNGWVLAEFADAIGVTRPNLQSLITDRQRCSPDLYIRLETVLFGRNILYEFWSNELRELCNIK